MNIKEVLEKHKEWLENSPNGERAKFIRADLRGIDLRGVDLRAAVLRGADLKRANLRGAILSGADFTVANLEGADLRGADLRGAILREANVEGTDFEEASLEGIDLSRAKNMPSTIGFIKENFEFTNEGIIAYKTFGGSFNPPGDWRIEKGSIISENVNFCRTESCGCGINVAPLGWVYQHYEGEIWKVLIRWEWLAGVCVPYNTDGKIRCERVELIEVVDEKSLSRALRKIIY